MKTLRNNILNADDSTNSAKEELPVVQEKPARKAPARKRAAKK